MGINDNEIKINKIKLGWHKTTTKRYKWWWIYNGNEHKLRKIEVTITINKYQ